jgi:tetratricopeptide (TPR) repeat protein
MRRFLFIVLISIFGCTNQGEKTIEMAESDVPQDSAVSVFDQLNQRIKSSPNNPELYVERANLHVKKNAYKLAVKDLERAIALDSNNANYYVLLSTIEFRNKKPSAAMDLLQKALVKDPQNITANLKVGELFMYLENYEDAFKHINIALKQDIYNAQGYFLKGMIHKFQKDTAKAVSSFQTCVEQDPDFYDAFIQLGLIYASVYDDLAIAYYDNALDVRPKSTEALYNKALYLQSTEKLQEADKLYKTILEIDPNYYIAYYNMGFLRLVYAEDYDSAATLFSLAIDKDPSYFEAFYNRGFSYELQGNKAKALVDYKKALEIKPDFTLAAKGVSRVQD